MDGFNAETLELVKRTKEKGFEFVILRTSDKRFQVEFEEEYNGSGIENKVKLYWRGLIPYYLSSSQKQDLIETVQAFLKENVYGKSTV